MKKKILILIGFLTLFTSQFTLSIFVPPSSLSWFYNARDEFISVDMTDDGKYIVAGTENGYVYLFEKSKPKPLQTYYIYDMAWHVGISDDGNYIIAGQYSGRFFVFEKSSSRPLWEYQDIRGIVIGKLKISPDGNYIAAYYNTGILFLFKRTSSIPLWNSTLYGPIAFSPKGDYLAAGTNGHIHLLNLTNQVPIWDYIVYDAPFSIRISNDGQHIAVAAADYDERMILLYNKSSITPIWYFDADLNLRYVDISDNGNYIVTGSWNNKVSLFHRSNPTPLWTYTTDGEINCISINSDASYIGVFDTTHTAYLFKRSHPNPIWLFRGSGDNDKWSHLWHSIKMSSNGRYLAFVSDQVYFIDQKTPILIAFGSLFLRNPISFSVECVIATFISIIYKKKKEKIRDVNDNEHFKR